MTGSKPKITDQKLMLFSHGTHHPLNISPCLVSYETNEISKSKVVTSSSGTRAWSLKHKLENNRIQKTKTMHVETCVLHLERSRW